jgi:hypothetical protein
VARVAFLMLILECQMLLAQSPIAPKPPFTSADAEHGKATAETSARIRRDIKNMRDPADPFKIMCRGRQWRSLFTHFPASSYPPVHVDRALYDCDIVKVGPLSVTTFLAPGHSPSPTSFLYSVREGNRNYRVFEFCCWEYPQDLTRTPS